MGCQYFCESMSEAGPLKIGWVSPQKPTNACLPYSCNSLFPQAQEGHAFALLKVDCHLERCYGTQVTYSQAEGKQTSLLEPDSLNLALELWGRWLCSSVRLLRCIINMLCVRLKTRIGTQPACSLQQSVWPPATMGTGEQQRHSSQSRSGLPNPPVHSLEKHFTALTFLPGAPAGACLSGAAPGVPVTFKERCSRQHKWP